MTDEVKKVTKCKFCQKEITWHKDAVTLKNYPKNLDGSAHLCQSQNRHTITAAAQTQKLDLSGFGPLTPPVIGMADPAKVHKVTIGCTINLHDFNNLKVEIEATDGDTARRALIELLGVTIPAESAVARECIDRYVKSVLVEKKVQG